MLCTGTGTGHVQARARTPGHELNPKRAYRLALGSGLLLWRHAVLPSESGWCDVCSATSGSKRHEQLHPDTTQTLSDNVG